MAEKRFLDEHGLERFWKNKVKPLADRYFVYEQSRPSDLWVVNHNMGKKPSVTVVDSAGTVVIGDIEYIDDDSLVLRFSGGFGGKAYLN